MASGTNVLPVTPNPDDCGGQYCSLLAKLRAASAWPQWGCRFYRFTELTDKLLGAGQHVERISLGMNLVMEASRYGVVWSRVIQS